MSNTVLGRSIRMSAFLLLVVLVLLAVPTACAPRASSPLSADVAPLAPRDRMRVATTTSLYDTGLWGYLEPMFEKKHNVELDILYTGSGAAFEYGKRGDVDAITIHAKAEEERFIADGYGVKRYPFAYNYFIIVGPSSDPAGVKGMAPEAAFRVLAVKGQADPEHVKFVSRGDSSGTHIKEKQVWQGAGYEYDRIRKSGAWYVEAGMGMGPTLLMASEKSAYTITDIGTYLSFKTKLDLAPVVDKGEILLNVYSAIAVNPEKVKRVSFDMASKLIEFLTSQEIQELIGKYGVKEYGGQLFIPAAGQDL